MGEGIMADDNTQNDGVDAAPATGASEVPVDTPLQGEAPAAAPKSDDSVTQTLKRLISPPHDPEMAGANYYIDRRAWVLALGVLGVIGFFTWFAVWVIGWGIPEGVPRVVKDDGLFSKGQLALVDEVNRQLVAWLYLARNYEILAMVMGATAAALTVLVGFIKEHTKSKMFLMALSAVISVFIGTLNPAEKAARFLNSWRVLYAEVNSTNAKAKLETDDFGKLADALSAAESALSQKVETRPAPPAPPPAQAAPAGPTK
jgi:hypothetical protein